MIKSPTKEKFKSLMPYFLLAVLIIAVYRISGELGAYLDFIRWIWGVMSPFFYGFLLAYVINLPCGSIQRLIMKTNSKALIKRRRPISLILVMLIFVLIIVMTLNWIIPHIAFSIGLLIETISINLENADQLIYNFNSLELFNLTIDEAMISDFIWSIVRNIEIDVLAAPLNALIDATGVLFRGVISFIASIYIMIEKEKSKAYINKLLSIFASDRVRFGAIEVAQGLNKNMRQYIHTQTLGGVILSVMSMVALIFMGSPYVLLIGIMLWLANYIPYFGSIIATLVAILVVAFTQGLTMGLIAAGVLILIQQVEVNIIQPKLMSDVFSMSPLLVIISISVGGAIAGILGMLVIIPVVAVLKDIFDQIVAYYERRKLGEELAHDNR